MYKAVFIDLDGTLLRDDHSISEESRNTIQKLVQKNILVVLVSARPIRGIIPISNWLGLQSQPLVSLNGSYIVMNNEVIFESCIDLETIKELHAVTSEANVTPIFYNGIKWYAERSNTATEREQKITDVKIVIAPFASLMEDWIHDGTCPNKVMVVGNEFVINALQSKLLTIYHDALNIYTSKPIYLEIMKKDASKTNALKNILEKFNISSEEAIAIGDNYNDKEMIMYAGLGVAMGNAPNAIKAVADYVTDTNENDGVRKAIEKFVAL